MKFFSSLLLVFAISFSSAQQLTLLEQFTNASCSTCRSVNPQINAYTDTSSRVLAIKWHINAPYNFDSMYHDNPAMNNWRRSYYSVPTSPYSVYMGGNYKGSSFTYVNRQDTMVQNTSVRMPRMVTISSTSSTNIGNGNYEVDIKVKNQASLPSAATLNILFYEEEIFASDFSFMPGGNGESSFKNVARYLISPQAGIPLNQSATDSTIFTTTVSLSAVKLQSQALPKMAVWIQDTTSKAVYSVADFDVPIATSNSLQSFSPNVSLYPNPASDVVLITGVEEGQRIVLMDVVGKKLREIPIAPTSGNVLRLDVASLQRGSYFISVQAKEGQLSTPQLLIVE